ncbi:nonstructural protein [Peromfec virus RodF5_3]|uniref:Nonstructural protein n=1 Tax=Peromfec virus RodF5_3 TaxID=2929339 RepID=A0A976R8C5_9VIRU|nr:nonstructural protein [Peromfec virus RodF5_3]
MTNNIYCIYDNVGKRYGQVYAFPTDGFALIELRPLMRGHTPQGADDPVQTKMNLNRYTVYKTGSIDIDTGVVTGTPPVAILWSETPYLETQAIEEKKDLPLANS